MSLTHRSRTALSPVMTVTERDGRVVGLSVTHNGSVPPILARFPHAVVRKATSQMELFRTRFEHGCIRAARQLDRTSQQIVLQRLLVPRCERIMEKLRIARIHALQPPTLTQRAMAATGLIPAQPRVWDDRGRGR